MKRIRFRLILAIGFLVAVFTSVLLYRTHINETEHLNRLFYQQLDMALNFDLSIRAYASEIIRPILLETLPEGDFIPKAMSSSYISREIFKMVQNRFSDVTIKFSSENPRNPINQAGPDEIELIRYFNQNPQSDSVRRVIEMGGTQYIVHAQAMRMEESCLRCHGDPADAPRKLIEIYGDEKSFHLPVGAVVGMDAVAVPVSAYHAMLTQANRQNFLIVFSGIVALFLSIFLVIRFMASDRKVMAQALSRSQIEKEAIMDSITDPMVYFEGPDLAVRWANKPAMNIAGMSNDQYAGLKCHKMYWGIDEPCEYCPALKTFETGAKHEVQIFTADGIYRHLKSYPVKDAGGGLLGVIEIASDITSIKQAEERILKSEEKYRSILDAIEDGYYEVDLAGNLVFFNDALCRILGYSRDELTGMNNRYFMSDETSRGIYQTFNRVFLTGEASRDLDISIISKEGTKRYINVSVSLMKGSDGLPAGFRGIARDVTEHRQAEEALRLSEEKFRGMAQTSIDTIFQINKNGNILYASPSILEIAGYTVDEIAGTNFIRYFPESQIPLAMEIFQKVISGASIRTQDLIATRKDGTSANIEASFAPIRHNDQVVGIQGTIRDISERIRYENLLKESEKKFRLLAESSVDEIFMLELDGNFSYVSPAKERIFGYPPEESLGKGFGKYFTSSELPKASQLFARAASGERVGAEALTAVRKDGHTIFIEVSMAPIIKDGKVTSIQGIVRDVTERKKAETALRESEAKYRLIFNSVPVGIIHYDKNGVVTQINPQFESITGYPRDKTIGYPVAENLKNPEIVNALKESLCGRNGFFEGSHISEISGKESITRGHFVPTLDEYNNVTGGICLVEDIAESHQAQQSLKESQKNLATLFDAVTESVFVLNREGVILELNKTTAERLNSTVPGMIGKVAYDFLPEDIARSRKEKIDQVFCTGKEVQFEDARPGRYFWHSIYPIFSEKGIVDRVAVFSQDIYDRKTMEESLKISEQNLKSVFDAINESVLLVDPEGIVLAVNQTAAQRLRSTADQIRGKNAFDFLPEDVAKFRKAKLTEVARSGKMVSFEDFRYGRHVWTNFYPIFDEHGHVNRIAVFTLDIHDRKIAEGALRDSEARYRQIFDSTPAALFYYNTEGVIVDCNPRAPEMMGGAREKIIGLNMFERSDHKEILACMRRSLKGDAARFEGGFTTGPDRRTVYVKADYVPVYSEGKVVGGLCIGEDVTAEKETQQALKGSEEKYRLIFDSSPSGILLYDINGVVLDVNETYLRMVDITRDAVLGFNILEKGNPMTMPAIKKALSGQVANYEGRFSSILNPQKNMMVRVVYYPLFSEENAVIGGAVTVEDITEKHLTQQALKASEEKYRLIFDSSPLGILHYDANGVITECNPKTLELSGATYDDLIGFDLINGVKEEAFLNAIRNSLAGTPGELEGKYLSVTGNKQSYLRAFTVPIHDAEKNIIGGICVAEDISEKILFEKALQQSEKRYRLLFDSAPLAFTLSDFEGSLMDFNQSALALFGYSDYETRNIKTSIGYSDPSIRRELLEALHRDGFVTGRELKFKKKNGELMDTLVNLTVIEIENKKYILSILADITKQKQIEKELKESHEKMRNLTKYLQSARENERTSIARELHDELGQVLTAINMEAAWVAQKISKEQEILKPRMEVISELAVGAIGSVKRIITELRPTLLSDLGLPAAIRWQAEDYQQRIGIKFEVAIEPEEFVLDEDLGIAIFRIFQEATTNAVRHSHATHVSISLSEDPSEIVLVVKDNGIGITEDKLELNESFGIMGMRERAEVFGGSLEISGMPGKGTTLEAKFPIWR